MTWASFGMHLGELDARELGGDGLEDALDVGRDVVLGVPKIEMAGTALEIEQDDALGLAEAGAAGAALAGRPGLKLQESTQAQAQE